MLANSWSILPANQRLPNSLAADLAQAHSIFVDMCEHDGEPFHESLSVAFKSALTKFDSLKLGMSWMYLIVRSLQPASAVVLQTCPPPPSPRSAYFAGGVSVQEVIAMLLDEMRQDQDFAHLLGNDLRHKEFVKFVPGRQMCIGDTCSTI